LENLLIYSLIDRDILGTDKKVISIALQLSRCGVDIIQLRVKSKKAANFLELAFKLKEVISGTNVKFIINDRVDIAKIVDADGVHLGQDDIPVCFAREMLGDKIIGKSCHCLEQAIAAQKDGVDYISIGPIFQTPLKPDTNVLGEKIIFLIKEKISKPFFVIGGINLLNISVLKMAGAQRFAFCRLLINSDAPCKMVEKIKRIVK